jgi:hypothetical protein
MMFRFSSPRLSQAVALRSLGFASAMVLVFAITASADDSTAITASGGWDTTTGKPTSCSTTDWLFTLSGTSAGQAPASIIALFRVGTTLTTVDLPQTSNNPDGSLVRYSVPVTSGNADYRLVGALAMLQTEADGENISFSLTNGGCGTVVTQGPPPPTPSSTPELGSLVLFGMGAVSIGSYALMRRRRKG